MTEVTKEEKQRPIGSASQKVGFFCLIDVNWFIVEFEFQNLSKFTNRFKIENESFLDFVSNYNQSKNFEVVWEKLKCFRLTPKIKLQSQLKIIEWKMYEQHSQDVELIKLVWTSYSISKLVFNLSSSNKILHLIIKSKSF